MTGLLPSRLEALQLQALRKLRLDRARAQLAKARAISEQAEKVVAERQQQVETGKIAVNDLEQARISTLVPLLPRWTFMVSAQRAKLVDRWERDVFALGNDRAALKAARNAQRQAEAELSRATAREDISRDLVRDVRRAQAARVDARAELELEDQGRPAATSGVTS